MTRAQRDAAIAQLRLDGLDVTEWRDEPGARYEEHRHPRREVRIVLEGAMTVTTPEGPRSLAPGDRIDLAPDEPHSAVVGPEGARYLAGTDRS